MTRLAVAGIAILVTGCSGHPTAPGTAAPPAEPIQTFLDRKQEFATAIAALGVPLVIDFEDVDASPVTDTIQGRTRFDGLRYVRHGFTFANANDLGLFVAPGGLFWNPSNSLSVGRFPFDPLTRDAESPFIEDDDLIVTLQPGCLAAGFSLVDNDTSLPDESVQFITSDNLIHVSLFPRTFVGVVSPAHPIVRIQVSEAADDYDDVTYDDFVCVR